MANDQVTLGGLLRATRAGLPTQSLVARIYMNRGLLMEPLETANIDVQLSAPNLAGLVAGIRRLAGQIEAASHGNLSYIDGVAYGFSKPTISSLQPLNALRLVPPMLRLQPGEGVDSWLLNVNMPISANFRSGNLTCLETFVQQSLAHARLPAKAKDLILNAACTLSQEVLGGISAGLRYSVKPVQTAHERMAALAEFHHRMSEINGAMA